MDYARQQHNPRRHALQLAVVVLLHLLLGWALLYGLGHQVIEVIREPIRTQIIDEPKPPPPPPPNPLPPPPRPALPPPSFVPPPEVQLPKPPPAPAITATREAPPAAARIDPAPPAVAPAAAPVAAAAPPAPPAPPVRLPARLDFGGSCRPEHSLATRRARAEGRTTIRYTVDASGAVVDASVEHSAGVSRAHQLLDRYALDAVRNCKGAPATVDGRPERYSGRVEFVWRIED